jgi:hypothetical protein
MRQLGKQLALQIYRSVNMSRCVHRVHRRKKKEKRLPDRVYFHRRLSVQEEMVGVLVRVAGRSSKGLVQTGPDIWRKSMGVTLIERKPVTT